MPKRVLIGAAGPEQVAIQAGGSDFYHFQLQVTLNSESLSRPSSEDANTWTLTAWKDLWFGQPRNHASVCLSKYWLGSTMLLSKPEPNWKFAESQCKRQCMNVACLWISNLSGSRSLCHLKWLTSGSTPKITPSDPIFAYIFDHSGEKWRQTCELQPVAWFRAECTAHFSFGGLPRRWDSSWEGRYEKLGPVLLKAYIHDAILQILDSSIRVHTKQNRPVNFCVPARNKKVLVTEATLVFWLDETIWERELMCPSSISPRKRKFHTK